MNHLRLEAEISSKLLIIWKSVLNESGVVSGYLFDMTSIFVSDHTKIGMYLGNIRFLMDKSIYFGIPNEQTLASLCEKTICVQDILIA